MSAMELPTNVIAATSLSTFHRLLKRFFIPTIISRRYLLTHCIAPGAARRYAFADGSSTVAEIAADVRPHISGGRRWLSCAVGQTDGRIALFQNAPGGHNNPISGFLSVAVPFRPSENFLIDWFPGRCLGGGKMSGGRGVRSPVANLPTLCDAVVMTTSRDGGALMCHADPPTSSRVLHILPPPPIHARIRTFRRRLVVKKM